MLLGGVAGLTPIPGYLVLVLGLLGGLSGRQSDALLVVLGLATLMSGPVILGLVNGAPWSRLLLAGAVSPVVGLIFAGLLFAAMGLLAPSMGSLPVDTAPIAVSVYTATWMGMAELLTRKLQAAAVPVLRHVAVAVGLVLCIDLLSNFVSALVTGQPSRAAPASWSAIALYSALLGVSMRYLSSRAPGRGSPSSSLPRVLFLGSNLLVLAAITVIRLVA